MCSSQRGREPLCPAASGLSAARDRPTSAVKLYCGACADPKIEPDLGGRTWGRRGHTPVVTVTGGHDTRVSLAALLAVRPGQRPRLIYRTHHARRGDKRKGFTETGYARFLDAAHQQLDGPLVLVWDGLNTHTSRAMREPIAARDWLTVFQLPAYAPELNPVEMSLSQCELRRSFLS